MAKALIILDLELISTPLDDYASNEQDPPTSLYADQAVESTTIKNKAYQRAAKYLRNPVARSV